LPVIVRLTLIEDTHMKKSLLLASLFAAVAMTACGQKEEAAPVAPAATPAPAPAPEPAPATAPAADAAASAADSAASAADAAASAASQ
jgi:hypothetical protein